MHHTIIWSELTIRRFSSESFRNSRKFEEMFPWYIMHNPQSHTSVQSQKGQNLLQILKLTSQNMKIILKTCLLIRQTSDSCICNKPNMINERNIPYQQSRVIKFYKNNDIKYKVVLLQ